MQLLGGGFRRDELSALLLRGSVTMKPEWVCGGLVSLGKGVSGAIYVTVEPTG